MSHYKKTLFALFAMLAFVVSPVAVFAGLSGTDADDARVKIYTKQGGEWIRAKTVRADDHGVLELENVIPGWYKMVIDSDDRKTGQTLAAKIRMNDRDGKRIKEKTDVEAYVDISGTKVFATTYRTGDDGWFEVPAITPEMKYYFDVKEKNGASLSKKEGQPRIKIKAKIDGSDWFRASYQRTDQDKVLEVENVLPGKYKFSYKNGDASLADPFTLKLRVVNEKGEKIKEETDVELYAYVNKTKVPMGTLRTDSKGWLTVPGVMTKIKYQVKVND